MKELETACSVPVSEEKTYAKEQLGTSRKEGATLLGLQWDKDSDTISDPLGVVSPITRVTNSCTVISVTPNKPGMLSYQATYCKVWSAGRRNFQAK